LKLLTDSAGTT